MKYRREIDGLRAVAVLPVILFHAGFEAFSGGFVGVDVFFVISGYLITTIILSDMNNGKFSIVTFYERRARRILPALFFVMICCLPFAWLWLTPNHLKDFSQSLAAITVFSSNILFWSESGYFGTAGELKPLLHTWSLAVEEQYYVLFPLLLMALWKLRKRWIFGTLVIVATVSLILAQWGAYNKPTAAFFLLPMRAWELAIGALIAFYFLYKKEQTQLLTSHKASSEALGALGLALIGYSIFAFDHSTPFPGVYALIPTLGTALIIIFATADTVVGRLLSSKSMVGIGLISYSTYLWHQPLFAFARHRSLEAPSVPLLLVLSVLSIVLAYLSWRFIEMPFRDKSVFNRKKIFIFSVAGSVFFAGIGLVGILMKKVPERIGFSDTLTASFVRAKPTGGCFDRKKIHVVDDWYCRLGEKDSDPTFFVFGDSHALSLFDAFDSAAVNTGVSGIFTGITGCTPFLGIHALRKDQNKKNCHELNNRVYNYVVENKIKKIFLVARWTYYTDGSYDGNDFSYVGITPDDKKEKITSRHAFETGLNKTVTEYKNIGVDVVIVSQAPQQKNYADSIYKSAYMLNGEIKDDVLREMSVSAREHKELNSYVHRLFESEKNIGFFNFDNELCDSEYCTVGTKSTSYYFDDDHLSSDGAKKLIPKIEPLLHSLIK